VLKVSGHWGRLPPRLLFLGAPLGSIRSDESLMAAAASDGDGEFNSPAKHDTAAERVFEARLVHHVIRVIGLQAEGGGLGPHAEQGAKEIRRDIAPGRGNEDGVPERGHAGTACEWGASGEKAAWT
jgi:hypothetical protein